MRRAYPKPPAATSTATSKVMRSNRAADTKPEVRLRSALHRRGLRFRKNTRPVPALRCRADIVFSRAQVAVFVDGCFWHCCPEHGTAPRTNSSYWGPKLRRNVQRDLENTEALEAAGWSVVRVWEHEAVEEAAARVQAEVGRRATESR